MTTGLPLQRRTRIHDTHNLSWIPSAKIEYGFYLSIIYSLLADYLGIEVPLFAAGVMVFLAVYCLIHLRSRAKEVFGPIMLLFGCSISFILVQIVIHGVPPTDPVIRDFILWTCGIIVVRSLCLRAGFLQRCLIVFLLMGLMVVPYLTSKVEGAERFRAGIQVAWDLKNPNGLGAWFGFCAITLIIFGLQARRGMIRAAAWFTAIGCLFILGLTVSRGGLIGTAIALAIVFRDHLKRAFVPTLVFIVLGWLAFETGVFDMIVGRYEERATEETGRLLLWPEVIKRITAAPIIGVGHDDMSTYLPTGGMITTPHNGFLFFALTSGIVPLTFWVVFWIRAAAQSLSTERSEYGPYKLPFLVYSFVYFMVNDINIVPWVMLAFSIAAGSVALRQERRMIKIRRVRPERFARTEIFWSRSNR